MEIQLSLRSKNDDSVQELRLPLGDRLTLGRDPESAVPLDATGVSREHLVLEPRGDQILVTDVSSNGTWLNGGRLIRGEPVPVNSGDVIEVPGYRLEIHAPGGAVVPAESAPLAPVEALVAAPPAEVALAKRSILAPVSDFLASFTGLEKLLIFISLFSLVLVMYYKSS